MKHLLLFSLLGTTPIVDSYDTNFEHRHDSGIYSRIGLGLAFVSLTTLRSEPVKTNGLAVAPELTIGGYLTGRFVVGGGARAIVSSSVVRLNIGPSVTFYPTDSIYISLQIGPEIGSDQGTLDQWSLGSEFSVGWLGWVGKQSQLGAAAFLAGETFNLDSDDTTLSGWRAGARLTFSYN